MKNDRVIRIFSGTMWEAELVKSLLMDANIESYLKNTVINSYAFDPIGAEGVQVMILESDKEEAQAIVDAFNKA